MSIDWVFTNPERDVETATVGPDNLCFVIDIWHGVTSPTCDVVVWRDQAAVDANLILERHFDNVAQAKEWVQSRFGTRTRCFTV